MCADVSLSLTPILCTHDNIHEFLRPGSVEAKLRRGECERGFGWSALGVDDEICNAAEFSYGCFSGARSHLIVGIELAHLPRSFEISLRMIRSG
jgi:hypothetical protein